MAKQREHLSRAPVREALVDIQFAPSVSIDAIDGFIHKLGDEVRTKVDLLDLAFSFDGSRAGEVPTTHSRHMAIGRRLELSTGPYVLQCRMNGFTLSRLSPYAKWSELRAEARRLWDLYRDFAGVNARAVNRVAVRYINGLTLPLPFYDFADFLECPPNVPKDLPQSINGFLNRVGIPIPEAKCFAVVTQALEGPVDSGPTGKAVNVILDIDVFQPDGSQPTHGDSIWETLDVLRGEKNRIFFAYITERTVEMYE